MTVYRALSDNDRRAMLEQRLRSYEADHYGHELNRLAVAALPASEHTAEEIARAEAAQATLEAAMAVCCAELDALDGVAVQDGTELEQPAD